MITSIALLSIANAVVLHPGAGRRTRHLAVVINKKPTRVSFSGTVWS